MSKFKPLLAKLAIASILLSVVGAALVPALAKAQDVDADAPSSVDNVKAMPGDGEVTVSWDAATDNTEVTGYAVFYGTTSVVQAYLDLKEGEDPASIQYENVVDVENVLEHTVEGLENDTTYYFAVIAVDAAGNESLEYSKEVSATPVAAEAQDDGTPPTVVSATASSCTTVELTFSEPVVVPATNPGSAFTIEDFDTLEFLNVTHAVNSSMVSTLTLTTETMTQGAQYRLTAGTSVKDGFGNPVVSGTSDTAVFTGVECTIEPDAVADDTTADTDAPKLESARLSSMTELELTFDEPVFFPELGPDEAPADGEEPKDANLKVFSVFDAADQPLELLAVAVSDSDPVVLVLTTTEHAANAEYFVSVTGLLDEAGNATTGDFKSSASYVATLPDANDGNLDLTPPENVTNLLSSVVDSLVNLSWGTVGEAVDQYLYVSTDNGVTYERKAVLSQDVSSYSFEGGVEGQTYLFKVVTVDENGNQSDGTVATATLPVTGPGLALLAAASLLGGAGLSRKKKARR